MHHFSQGIPTQQAHKGIPDGLYEEEQGLSGFFGPVSHLIRKKPSTRWVKIEGELKPRLFDIVKWEHSNHEQRLLFNSQISISYEWMEPVNGIPSVARRNADGDVVYFCHRGAGEIYTEYGLLTYTKGQYVVIPKCVTFAIRPSERTQFLKIESKTGHYTEPERGLVGRHAVYDINTIGKPDLEMQNRLLGQQDKMILEIEVKHNDKKTYFKYEEEIFDVVGWKGDLFPFTLHISDIMPLMSHRAHLPPSAHSTFIARDFVICTFVPRPLETDQDALKVPFYHQNIDYDEVLFYHEGNFFSRDNLHAGMMSFHPAGFPHGPHPKAVKGVVNKTHTDEYAVMIDTRHPLFQDKAMSSVEQEEYWKSWIPKE